MINRCGVTTFLVCALLALMKCQSPVQCADSGLLSIVLQGCKNATSVIQTGTGMVTVSSRIQEKSGVVQQDELVYDVQFKGDKFRALKQTKRLIIDSVPVTESKTVMSELAYDGAKAIELIRRNPPTAIITDAASGNGKRILSERRTYLSTRGQGLLDLNDYEIPRPDSAKVGPRIIGREVINGEECIIVEVVYVSTSTATHPGTDWHLSWVNPARGYTVAKRQAWAQGPLYKEKFMTAERVVDVKDYGGGLWGPSKVTHTEYRLDAEGKQYANVTLALSYDENFRFNVPVDDSSLQVQLPTGTSVHDEMQDTEYTVP